MFGNSNVGRVLADTAVGTMATMLKTTILEEGQDLWRSMKVQLGHVI